MVGAINAPTSGNTFDAYKANAKVFQGASGVSLCASRAPSMKLNHSFVQQGEGNLVGVGASASALPAPLTDGAQLFTNNPPVGSATGSGGAPAPSASGNSTSTGSIISVNTFLVFSAAALGVALV